MNYFEPFRVNLAAGKTMHIDSRTRESCLLCVSVMSGVLDVHRGFVDGTAPTIPDFRFTPVGHPVQVRLPSGWQVFTLIANQTCQATAYLMG